MTAISWTVEHPDEVRDTFEKRVKSLSDSDPNYPDHVELPARRFHEEECLERMEAALERILNRSYVYSKERRHEGKES